MTINERIFYLLQERKMTQAELSKQTGIATSTISDWKKKLFNPKAESIEAIAKALGVLPENLITGKGIDSDYIGCDYVVTSSDVDFLIEMHRLSDDNYLRLMDYMNTLQRLEDLEKDDSPR